MSKELRTLERREAEMVKNLAAAIAKRDQTEDDQKADKKQRDRLKDRKERDLVYNAPKLKALNAEIATANRELRRVRKNIEDRRGRLAKIRQSLKAARRKAARPKVIDLKLGFRPMTSQSSVNKVIGHYTAGPRDKDTADAIRLCKIYHQSHLNQGWSGEGYHICFTVDGNILVLRPARYVGAHTLGANTGSVGVMCHGTTGDTPSRAQKRAIRWWAKNGHKQVMGAGRVPVKPESLPWFGHNDFNATSCPGAFKPTYISKGK
jgi:hypothetical protein